MCCRHSDSGDIDVPEQRTEYRVELIAHGGAHQRAHLIVAGKLRHTLLCRGTEDITDRGGLLVESGNNPCDIAVHANLRRNVSAPTETVDPQWASAEDKPPQGRNLGTGSWIVDRARKVLQAPEIAERPCPAANAAGNAALTLQLRRCRPKRPREDRVDPTHRDAVRPPSQPLERIQRPDVLRGVDQVALLRDPGQDLLGRPLR